MVYGIFHMAETRLSSSLLRGLTVNAVWFFLVECFTCLFDGRPGSFRLFRSMSRTERKVRTVVFLSFTLRCLACWDPRHVWVSLPKRMTNRTLYTRHYSILLQECIARWVYYSNWSFGRFNRDFFYFVQGYHSAMEVWPCLWHNGQVILRQWLAHNKVQSSYYRNRPA